MPKKGSTKKKTTQKRTVKPQTKLNSPSVNNKAKKQVASIVTFAFALLLLAIVFIPGANVWHYIRVFLFGLFGVCTYIIPFIIGVISILSALEKFTGKIKSKIIEVSILVILVTAAIDVFATPANSALNFQQHISAAYLSGIRPAGGGFFGALIGNTLVMLCDKIPAAITICILIFVFLMLLSGTTLIKLFTTIAKPVKRLEKAAEDSFEDLEENPKKKTKLPPKEKEEENIDISLTEEEEIKKRQKLTKEKKDKLIDLYNGVLHEDEDDDSETIIMPIVTEKPAQIQVENKAEEVSNGSDDNIEEIDITALEDEDFEVPEENMISQKPQYVFPPISLLSPVKPEDTRSINHELEMTGKRLIEVLGSFGVEAKITNISRGPAVTRYELKPSAGVKISKITNLADDIALNLASSGIRIEAPIPNKAAVGIEVPNKSTNIVNVREIIDSEIFKNAKSKLSIALGKDIAGTITVTDIAKMPHGLIAGATGSGKSVCINSIIISLLYNASPDEVKLLLIDPKVVELGIYNGIPHLLVPVVTDPRKAAGSLGWAVQEMEKRYKVFAENDVRNLDGYNELAEIRDDLAKMPRVVIIIDELADLMMTAPGDVESSIMRITQKARAAGIHLIVATQRPSVDVVTGLIKANIPTRVAFAVSSQVDSRTILDVGGAEKLMGRGDMLFCPYGANKPIRIQGCYVSDNEVEDVVGFIKKSQKADYSDEIAKEIDRLATEDKNAKNSKGEDIENGDDADPELARAIEVVVEAGQASTSLLQRRLKLGYARAARIIDQMEARGIVDGYQGSKPRNVLITKDQLNEMKMRSDDEV